MYFFTFAIMLINESVNVFNICKKISILFSHNVILSKVAYYETYERNFMANIYFF